jgi:hypothetical protein
LGNAPSRIPLSLTTSKFPRRLAAIGIVIGFGFMAIWWYVDKYDPFHLPNWQQAQSLGNFSAPQLLRFLEDLTFALCPASTLHLFTMDMGNATIYVTWVLAALLNGPIYYGIGLILAALMKRRTQVPAGEPGRRRGSPQ